MALFGKDERTHRVDDAGPSTMGPVTRVPEATHGGEESVQAHLGKGSRIEGKLFFEGSVKIDGQVQGEIEAQESVIIGDSAVVTAQVHAATIIVRGKVTGDIVGRKRVELRAPAKVLGNITTPSIIVHDGVFFEGHCSMGSGDAKLDRSDKKVAIFPKEERPAPVPARVGSEAGK